LVDPRTRKKHMEIENQMETNMDLVLQNQQMSVNQKDIELMKTKKI